MSLLKEVYRDNDIRGRIAEYLCLANHTYVTPQMFYDRHASLFETRPRPDYRTKIDAGGRPYILNENISLLNERIVGSEFDTDELWNADKIRGLIANCLNLATQLRSEHGENAEGSANTQTEEAQGMRTALHHYLRWAIMGGSTGPAVADCMVLLGRHATRQRLQEAVTLLEPPK